MDFLYFLVRNNEEYGSVHGAFSERTGWKREYFISMFPKNWF